MANEKLNDTLIATLEKAKGNDKTGQDIELTDRDMEDVAGGACSGYCETFKTLAD